MALFNRFYNTVLEQKVLTCKNQIFFLQQGDTGKCTHFPYLMFSIIKIILDHIIEKKIHLILVLYFICTLISNFH